MMNGWSLLTVLLLFSRVLRDSTPRYVGPLVGRSVGRLVPFLLFRRFWAFWAHGSCPDDPVTFSSTAPAHPHATTVAVYPALFHYRMEENSRSQVVT